MTIKLTNQCGFLRWNDVLKQTNYQFSIKQLNLPVHVNTSINLVKSKYSNRIIYQPLEFG